MFGIDANPVEIKISLGLLQDKGVSDALTALIAQMSRAQKELNDRIEAQMHVEGKGRGLFPVG